MVGKIGKPSGKSGAGGDGGGNEYINSDGTLAHDPEKERGIGGDEGYFDANPGAGGEEAEYQEAILNFLGIEKGNPKAQEILKQIQSKLQDDDNSDSGKDNFERNAELREKNTSKLEEIFQALAEFKGNAEKILEELDNIPPIDGATPTSAPGGAAPGGAAPGGAAPGGGTPADGAAPGGGTPADGAAPGGGTPADGAAEVGGDTGAAKEPVGAPGTADAVTEDEIVDSNPDGKLKLSGEGYDKDTAHTLSEKWGYDVTFDDDGNVEGEDAEKYNKKAKKVEDAYNDQAHGNDSDKRKTAAVGAANEPDDAGGEPTPPRAPTPPAPAPAPEKAPHPPSDQG